MKANVAILSFATNTFNKTNEFNICSRNAPASVTPASPRDSFFSLCDRYLCNANACDAEIVKLSVHKFELGGN